MNTHFYNSPTSSSRRNQPSSSSTSFEERGLEVECNPGAWDSGHFEPQTPNPNSIRIDNSGKKAQHQPGKRYPARESHACRAAQKRKPKTQNGKHYARKESAETQDPQDSNPCSDPRDCEKYSSKLKTELCSYFSQTGFCKWADKCLFAHGVEEIKAKTHVPIRYKTKKCENYSKTGFCPYGQRCQYIHNLSYASMLGTLSIKFAQSESKVGPVEMDRFLLSQHFTQAQSDAKVTRLPVFAALMQEASV